MAALNDITVRQELRPCRVKTNKKRQEYRKGLFHCWRHVSQIIPPSPMIGGHTGGVVSDTYGMVEFEDGTIHSVAPNCIQFLDERLIEYMFPDSWEKDHGEKET